MSAYLLWHYGEALHILLLAWKNCILFPIYFFSIPLHLTTLFSSWKRQSSTSEQPGFHLEETIKDISFNTTSRILGAAIRAAMIISGGCFSILIAFCGGVGMLVWLLIPGIGFVWWGRQIDQAKLSVPSMLENTTNDLPRLIFRLAEHPQVLWIWQRLGINPSTVLYTMHQNNTMDHGSSWNIFQRELLSLLNNTPQEVPNDISQSNAVRKHIAPSRSPYTKISLEMFPHNDSGQKEITISDLFIAASIAYQPLKQFLRQHALGPADTQRLCQWYETTHPANEKHILLDRDKIKQLPGIGGDWAYGYTALVDQFAHDMTRFPTPYPLLIGREQELEQIEKILLKTENNNTLIVGEPGVDRHILLRTLAYRMAAGFCHPALAHTRLLLLDMHAIVSSQQSTGQIKGHLTRLLEEAHQAGNVIICIDELDRYVTTKEERIDLSDVWEKMAVSHQAFIAITTPEHFHRYIQQNPALAQLFEVVRIEPPPTDIVRIQLQAAIVPILEKKYNVWITYQSVEKVLEDAARFLTATPFPGSAVNLLDEVCVHVTTGFTNGAGGATTRRVVLPRHIDTLISEKFHTAVGSIASDEKEKLQRIEELLHKRVIGQDQAIGAIAGALRRARLHISSPNKPMGSFLFLGPTGVGKTETAKTIAEVYFGSEKRILRFDMGEFQKEEGIRRLIGSADGTPGELTAKLRENPFCVILFDEFEKADREIFNLFLPLIDEGYITDASGSRADARNAFIIATSNAGAEYIRNVILSGAKNPVGSTETGRDPSTSQRFAQDDELTRGLLEYIQSKNIFSPELINRFDATIMFTPLSAEHVRIIVAHMLESLNKRLSQEQISIAVTDTLIDSVARKGYDPEYGARAIHRVIQETVEDQIARQFITGTVAPGTVLQITPPT